MKKTFTLFLIGLTFVSFTNIAKAQLTPGDIAITGVNGDAPAAFQFVALSDIPAGTIITFTDNAWDNTAAAFNTNEGYVTWTSPSTIVAKGASFTITQGTTDFRTATITPNVGSLTAIASFNIATAGEQIIAFEGRFVNRPTSSASQSFLWALSTREFIYAPGNNTNTSDLPSTLSSYSLAFTGTSVDFDNGYFANGNSSATTVAYTGTKTGFVALATDRNNYYLNNTGPLTFPTYAVVLPLQLLSFSASPKESTVAFNWKTANEHNTRHFEIEQSFDGTTFKSIATVAAAGNSTSEKSYGYASSLNAATTFYRLKMVDMDGKSNTSSVVKVAPSKTGFLLGNVYPIPAKSKVTVEWNSRVAGATTLTLTDISGRTIKTFNLQSAQGFNQYNLDVNALTSGQYFLRLKNDVNQVQTIITKQ